MTNYNKQIYLESVARKCMAELDEMNIPYKQGITFEVNTRAKSRYGQCRYRNGRYSINIMAELIDPSYLMGLKNTIIHELIHTCDGCMNHGRTWQKWAGVVNNVKHYGIERCSTREAKGLPKVDATRRKIERKYVITCENCGATITRARATKVVQHPEWYRCRCGGKLHVEQI